MPFTFAHPAAVLPLRRSRLLQTLPLVIGSMVPDAPYFFPGRIARDFPETHTLTGSIVTDLPLGMLILLVTLWLRGPLTVLLGPRARFVCLQAADRFLERPHHWLIAILSLVLGSWTHLAWDSVTHQSGWTATRVPALQAPVSVFGWVMDTSHLLQYVSSVFGLVVLALWYRHLLRTVPASVGQDQTRPAAHWGLLGLITALSLVLGIWRAFHSWQHVSYYNLEYLLATRTVGWFAVLYVATGFAVLLSRGNPTRPVRYQ